MKKKVLCVIAAVVFCLALPLPASANSAGLPYLTILVENPPAGLELSLTVESEGTQKTYPIEGERILWEGCYRFYNHLWSPWAAEGAAQPTAVLEVDTGEESFSLTRGAPGLFLRGECGDPGPAKPAAAVRPALVADAPAHRPADGYDPGPGGGSSFGSLATGSAAAGRYSSW